MSEVIVTPVSPQGMLARATEIAAIHEAAFDKSDQQATIYRDVDIPEMARYPGLACVVATTDDHAVGFAVGHDTVARPEWLRNVMAATQGPPVHDWLSDAWYLSDIATLPELQRRGIGRRMHDALMDLTVDRRRMLVTYHGDHPAKRFYRRLGWVELVPDLEYVSGAPLTSLMVYIGRKP
jgi:ribosomal protein S18 acetylase RimI-like enzyme